MNKKIEDKLVRIMAKQLIVCRDAYDKNPEARDMDALMNNIINLVSTLDKFKDIEIMMSRFAVLSIMSYLGILNLGEENEKEYIN